MPNQWIASKFVVIGIVFFSLLCALVIITANDYIFIILLGCVFLGLCAFLTENVIFIAVIFSTVIIPGEILPMLSGHSNDYGFGYVRIHPFVVTIIIASFILLRKYRSRFRIVWKNYMHVLLLLALFNIIICTNTILLRGFYGLPQYFENYFTPAVLLLALSCLPQEKLESFLKKYVIIIVLISFYGLIEFLFSNNILYKYLYSGEQITWINSATSYFYRITTTIGHPLKNAVYFLFAIPLVIRLFHPPVKWIYLGSLCGAILATGARSALILIVFVFTCVAFQNIKTKFSVIKNMFYSALLIVSIFCLVFMTFFGRTIVHRFITAGDSTQIRIYSMSNVLPIMQQNLFYGKGLGKSFDDSKRLFKYDAGFENPWIMLLVDTGMIAVVLYISFVLCILRTCYKKQKLRHVFLSLLVTLFMLSGFNSFGARDTLNILIYFVSSLAFAKMRVDYDTENQISPINYITKEKKCNE